MCFFEVFRLIFSHGYDIIVFKGRLPLIPSKEKAMGKGIYTYYKERLIEIGGNNKCLYLKNITRKSAYDLGKIFEGRDDKVSEFIDFLWSGGKHPLTVISNKEKKHIIRNLDVSDKSAKIKKDMESGIPVDEATVKKLERMQRDAE